MTDSKKVFISHADTTKDWVLQFSQWLAEHAVEVIAPIYDLKFCMDQFDFIEQQVQDDTIDKVLLICDATYVALANDRKGLVGATAQINSYAIYQAPKQTRFIPIVIELDDKSQPVLPHYLKSRHYIDFSSPEQYQQNLPKLLQAIWETEAVPEVEKPNPIPQPNQHIKEVWRKNIVHGNVYGENVHVGDIYNSYNNTSPNLPKELFEQIPRSKEQRIERKEQINELAQLLDQEKSVVIINPVSGWGKTTLAQLFALHYYDNYEYIAWVTIAGKDIKANFLYHKILLKKLNIHTNLDVDAAFGQLMYELRSLTRTPQKSLLIIDNAPPQIKELLNDFPERPQWQLLITAKAPIDALVPYHLPKLSQEDCVQLFVLYYNNEKLPQPFLEKLVEQLGYHTLSIEILAKTAQALNWTQSKINAIVAPSLWDRITSLWATPPTPEEIAEKHIKIVFDNQRPHLNDTEKWLLSVFTCFPKGYQTTAILTDLLSWEKEEMYNKEDLIHDLEVLKASGWIFYDQKQDAYKMHDTVRKLVIDSLPLKERRMDDLRGRIIKKLRSYDRQNNLKKLLWLPYAEALLAGIKNLKTDTANEFKADLAIVYHDLGQFHKAKALLTEVVAYTKDRYGSNHIKLASSYHFLALVIRELGALPEARDWLKKAIKIQEIHLGNGSIHAPEEHVNVATNYHNLASVLQNLGELDQAKEFLQKAIDIQEKQLGIEHYSTAISYATLASVLQQLGELDQAKELLQKAIDIQEKQLGIEHYSTAISYATLASVLQQLGELDQAKELLQKAIDIQEKQLGIEHYSTAISYATLASVLKDLGELPQAKEFLQKAIDIKEKQLGIEHYSTATSYHNLASVLQDLGEPEQAKVLVEKTIKIQEKQLGIEHHSTASSYTILAAMLQDLGDLPQAKVLLQKAIAIQEKQLGIEHHYTAISYATLAAVLQDLGELQLALPYIKKAQKIPTKHQHYKTIKRSLRRLQKALTKQRKKNKINPKNRPSNQKKP